MRRGQIGRGSYRLLTGLVMLYLVFYVFLPATEHDPVAGPAMLVFLVAGLFLAWTGHMTNRDSP